MEQVAIFASKVYNDDKLLYLACLLVSLPLSQGLKLMPNATYRHVYGTLLGIIFCAINFGLIPLIFCVATSVSVWKIIHYPWSSPMITTIFAFVTCSIAHLWIMFHDYLGWHMDFTGVQNILTLKFVMWAFNMHNRRRNGATASVSVTGKVRTIEEYDRKAMLVTDPTLLQYFSHLFWFSNVLTMPIFEPKQHIQWVETYDTSETFKPSFIALIYGLGIGLIGFVVQPHMSTQWMMQHEWTFETSIWHKMGYIWAFMVVSKLPYYAGWLLAESSTIACGMGRGISWLAPPDINNAGLNKKWIGASTVAVVGVESSRNFVEVTRSWNYSTSGWLRHYVYLRVHKKYATVVTFFVSALWHGFYPGYYISFMGAALHTIFGRLLFKYMDKFEKNSTITNTCLILLNSFITSYLFAGFIMLGWEQCWHVYGHTYFVGHLIVIGFSALLWLRSGRSSVQQSAHTNQ